MITSVLKMSSPKKLREKVFEVRNSPLTDRLEQNEDIKTIYNLFAIILISLLTNTVIYDYLKTGELNFGLRLIYKGFNNFHLVVLAWLLLNVLGYLVYCWFMFWGLSRGVLPLKALGQWDKIHFGCLLIYYAASIWGIQEIIKVCNFAPCSAAVIFLEEVRLLMKQHAFVRSNTPKFLNYKPHTEQDLVMPSFGNFLYFSFAPTLIYRDSYPRAKGIRWKFVFYNFFEVLGLIYLLSLVVERFLIPPFEEICLRKYTMSDVTVPILANSLPGIMFMLCGFYSVLHSFQNAFAELLCFGDRMFYKEWWTSRSLSEYYRTWNVIVHDWLFHYVYKDMYEIVAPRNKVAAKLAVFIISAVVHEWIITNALGLFLPIQFLQFFVVSAGLAVLNLLDLPVGNLLVWYFIVIGSGMQVNLYTLEFFARRNCPYPTNSSLDFFKMRNVIVPVHLRILAQFFSSAYLPTAALVEVLHWFISI